MVPDSLKKELSALVKQRFPRARFVPGETPVPVSGKVFDESEILNCVDAILDGWWTEGRFAQEFEREFGKFLGIRYVSLVNSGSSANLLALTALTASTLGDRALKPGDEVITVATGFPTTVNPIIQNRCIPVFLDIDIRTKNVNPRDLERALSKRTKAVMMAHTLGNPLPLNEILTFTKKHGLWFIEDCCDALGAQYDGKRIGTFGDVATFSFYPAHQITMGEGGAVVTAHPLIHRAIRQFRDWGRDCWCDTGKDNTCRKRFSWKMGDLPYGYDHKYIYSQIGYNLKLTDMQAAIGLAQLRKLPEFIRQRMENHAYLDGQLRKHDRYFILPESDPMASPSWFGFLIVIRDGSPFTRLAMVEHLESRKIATRALFGGNLLRHPAYRGRKDIRTMPEYPHSDSVMNNGFWIGVYPGLTRPMLQFVVHEIDEFIANHGRD